MIPYVTGTCHIIIGKGNGGDASSFHLRSFLCFGFSVSTTRKAIHVALGGDTATSQTVGLIDAGKPRSDHWCLSDTQINAADRSMSGSRRTIQVQEEDKRRLLVRLMKRNGLQSVYAVIKLCWTTY
ncbi:hypothetical protein IGI04_032567 [Brassica rapa subsp. trilocularis]|uniref:Uncharacterized protein n=1 Tax=Brassica rapa subsp. trilocularis TaxID=1813537 RepID=A0ABQ7M0X5_BRACM|nr:hypothetical protein IGI04_032567 [Brassica rapa subsp. trilocularis]